MSARIPPPPPLAPVPDRPAPLSTAQARLWFLHTSRPATPEYNLQVALLLRGRPDREALLAALGELVRRHEPLRTLVAPRADGPPVQRVLPGAPPAVDQRPAPGGADVRAAAEAVATQELAHVFDLEREPPLRVRLARPEDHRDCLVLVLTLHHLAFDGSSTGLLMTELAALYRRFTAQEDEEEAADPYADGDDAPYGAAEGASPLGPAPRVSYSDYAFWERETLRRSRDPLLRHWTETLAGAEELTLPTDREGNGVGGPLGTASYPLTRRTLRQLREVARQSGATVFAVLLAAYFAVLGRYGGQREFVVGTPVSGRTDAALEPLIGCFVNTLCLRASLREDDTFEALVRRCHLTLADAVAHQALPFEEVVRALRPARGSDRNPLFRAFCSLAEPPGMPDFAGHDCALVIPSYALSRFDLNVTFVVEGAAPTLHVEYSELLFDAATADALARRLGVFLDWAVARPGRALGDIPWTTPGERRTPPDRLNGSPR